MRRIGISILIILISLFGLNVAALFMHKKSVNAAFLILKSKLDERGSIMEFTAPEFKSYIAWKPVFSLASISFKQGNKNDRTEILLRDLIITISTFDKKIELSLLNDIESTERKLNKERKFVCKFAADTSLKIDLDASVDLFLRDLDEEPLAKIKTLSFANSSFSTYELFADNSIENIFTALDNFILIKKENNSLDNDKENYKLDISGGMKQGFYNPNSKDKYTKMLARFGNALSEIKLSYSHILTQDKKVTEEFNIYKITSLNDVFFFNISGKGSRSEKQRMPEWKLEVEANNYKEMIKSCFEILNHSIKIAGGTSLNMANSKKIEKLINIFSTLPEAKITDEENIKFFVEKSDDTDFKVGGVNISVISNEISKIFIGYLK